jgi:hypothetical protein
MRDQQSGLLEEDSRARKTREENVSPRRPDETFGGDGRQTVRPWAIPLCPYSFTVTFMRIGSSGLSRSSQGSFAIMSIISIPRMISPKIE